MYNNNNNNEETTNLKGREEEMDKKLEGEDVGRAGSQ